MLSIVIPSYLGHIRHIERFLISNAKHNKDIDNTNIYIIISYEEKEIFTSVTSKFKNVHILIFKDLMLKYFDINIENETTFLLEIGSFSFQSLKKLVGMLDCKDETIFIVDSETYFIRDCEVISECNKTETVLYSKILNNDFQEKACDITKKILELDYDPPLTGYVFSYQWIFKKIDVQNFFNKYKNNIINNTIKTTFTLFFIELVILYYCLKNSFSYKFIDATDILSYTNTEHFWMNAKNNEKDKEAINKLLSVHNLFCYSIQNNWNDPLLNENNTNILNDFKNFKILTNTPQQITII